MVSTPSGADRYGPREAESYDHESAYDKGSRALHRTYLRDVVLHLFPGPVRFLDLGCGTGYLTEAFWEASLGARGVAVDGSDAMLHRARARLAARGGAVEFRHALLQRIDWEALPRFDIVFSSLAIHFLDDGEKLELLRRARAQLAPGGVLVLFGQHVPRSPWAAGLVRGLACRDIQRRLRESLGLDPEMELDLEELRLERIMDEDARMRRDEGGHDLDMDEYRSLLRRAGFGEVAAVFQETRYFGMVAAQTHGAEES
jgi:SAM-dependent methyltransferase